MSVTYVDSPDDERLSDYRAVSEPELARTRGVFIAEGRLVVRRLLTVSRFATRSVMVTATAMNAIKDVLTSRPDVPVYEVSTEVMKAVSGFHIHRGCLAAGERPPHADWRACVAEAQRAVILERVGDADNIGGIFRNAAAFGAGVVVGPDCADPLYRKAIRTSMGAALTVPFADAGPWPAALSELAAGGWTVAALTPAADAMPLRDFSAANRSRRIAIVLGHEGEGLTPAALEASGYRVRIPIRPSVDSLNVAAAAAIALYELS